MAGTFKIGIIGCGMGQAHLAAVKKNLEDIEVVAVADIDEKLLNKASTNHDVPMRFTDYKKMLEVDEIRAVVIATPNGLHAPMAIDAMKAGKHVLVEKPPSLDIKGAEDMLAASKKTGKMLMYALCFRFRPDVREVKRLAEKGMLGDPYYARTTWYRRWGIPIRPSFCNKEISGGGPMIDLGVHILDMTWWIMGSPRPVAVSGATYDPFMKSLKKKDLNVEDLAVGMVRFENGSTIMLEASWATYAEWEDIDANIFGTKGGASLRLNPREGQKRLTVTRQEKGTWYTGFSQEIEWQSQRESQLANQLRYFSDCIKTGKKNDISTGEEGVEMMKMLRGLYDSAASGREVVLKK